MCSGLLSVLDAVVVILPILECLKRRLSFVSWLSTLRTTPSGPLELLNKFAYI